MMSMQELIEILKISGASNGVVIQPEHRLKEDLLMTSLTTLLLITHIEEKLNCNIDPLRVRCYFLG